MCLKDVAASQPDHTDLQGLWMWSECPYYCIKIPLQKYVNMNVIITNEKRETMELKESMEHIICEGLKLIILVAKM